MPFIDIQFQKRTLLPQKSLPYACNMWCSVSFSHRSSCPCSQVNKILI